MINLTLLKLLRTIGLKSECVEGCMRAMNPERGEGELEVGPKMFLKTCM